MKRSQDIQKHCDAILALLNDEDPETEKRRRIAQSIAIETIMEQFRYLCQTRATEQEDAMLRCVTTVVKNL